MGKGEVLTVVTVGGLTVGKRERLRVGRGNIREKGKDRVNVGERGLCKCGEKEEG